MSRLRPKSGFTLVELLVVASIFAALFALLLAGGGASSSRKAQIRQGAQMLASVLVATQSKSLGNEAGAAVIFARSTLSGSMTTSVFFADALPFIMGTATGMPPSILSSATASVTVTPTSADATDLVNGYKIIFYKQGGSAAVEQPPTAWMGFTAPSPPVGTVSFRTTSGQTSSNTIWPKPVTSPFDILIARYPVKSLLAMEFPKLAALDLRYSGYVDTPNSLAGDVAIAFDRIGGIDAVMQEVLATSRTTQPIDPIVPICLLVAAREDIVAGSNTLANDDSIWLMINPQTGRVSVAANVPQSGADQAAVRAARANARAGIGLGK